jgi:diguanylate cyclase (GGDEF)-like protein
MLNITGWRFVIFIALPLFISAFGTISLTFDLVRSIEFDGNLAEQKRNEIVIQDVIQQQEADLAKLAAINAHWPDAVQNTTGIPNQTWFDQIWSHSLASTSFDTVAVLDANTGETLLGRSFNAKLSPKLDLFGQNKFSDFKSSLMSGNSKQGVASGFLQTANGPSVVAMAPIFLPGQKGSDNGRVFYFSKSLDDAWLGARTKQLSLKSLAFTPDKNPNEPHLDLKSLNGQNSLTLTWRNSGFGEIMTTWVWSKIGVVLCFLVVVLMGVAIVCWKLVQQLTGDQEKSQHDALHDHLTGLPNRAALSEAMQKLHLEKQAYSIAFADLDGFKEVNDAYGHEYGDKLIFMIAKGLEALTASAVMCSRLGGDEFVVMFKGEHAATQARAFSDHFILMLKHPFDMGDCIASVGVSIGIADTDGTLDVTEMMRRSDIAMYRAKEAGKNRFCIFNEAFDLERNENLSIATELKSILSSRNLDIMFQPVVNARSGEITGVEALARWPSSSHRTLSADKFITVAEKSGLIDNLGELILEKACFHAANWPDLRLAVNISAVQLNNPGFVKKALGILERSGIATNRVEFEITETSLINDTDRAKQVFKALQQQGIQIALDDFGTGFSSIGYLRTFQFDRIKIDRSIVSKVLSSASELAVVQGTLLVARGLSADVTAEGVETAEEASVLRLAGCTELQGYYYHKPMVASQVTAVLEKAKLTRVPRTQMSA